MAKSPQKQETANPRVTGVSPPLSFLSAVLRVGRFCRLLLPSSEARRLLGLLALRVLPFACPDLGLGAVTCVACGVLTTKGHAVPRPG